MTLYFGGMNVIFAYLGWLKAWFPLYLKGDGRGWSEMKEKLYRRLQFKVTREQNPPKLMKNILHILITWLTTPSFVRNALTQSSYYLAISYWTNNIYECWHSILTLERQLEGSRIMSYLASVTIWIFGEGLALAEKANSVRAVKRF